MRTLWLLLIIYVGILSACSSPDGDAAGIAQLHPPPFEMRSTDSSIVATYMWEDTLSDYYLAVTREDENGGITYITPRRGIIFPPAMPQHDVEFLFDDLGIRNSGATYAVWFLSDAHAEDEYGYKWMFVDGKFEPVLFKNSKK